MNIRKKIVLLGGLGLLGVLGISAVNVSSLNAIRDEAKKISEIYVPQMALLAEVDEDFNDARRLSLAFMAETRQSELDALEAGFDKEVREAAEGAEKYLATGLVISEQQSVQQLNQDIARYRQLVKASFLLQRQGLLDEARAASVNLRPFADVVTKRSQGLKEAKLARIEQSDSLLVQSINQTLQWSAAIGLACLFIFLFAAYKISRSISQPLNMMRQTIGNICQNLDLRQRAHHKQNDEVGEALTSFNHLLDNLNSNMQDMRQMGVSMGSAAGQLQATSHGLFEQASTTSQASASMAATVEEVACTIKLVAEHVQGVDAVAQAAGQDARNGSAVIVDTIRCIEDIATQVKATAIRIDNLNGSTEHINSAVVMIKEIAEQTNLLALNAAIEAARAGESGRGFAVVADEVRKLAERTAQTTAQITATIVDIQQETRQSTVAMASAVQSVEEGVVRAGAANKAVTTIVLRSDEVKRQIGEITQSMQEQSQALGLISADIERVASLAESSYQSAGELAGGSRSLHEHGQKMVLMLNRYQLA